ncbi:hypothetical protein QU39_00230, partial [Staphylococcus aureus]
QQPVQAGAQARRDLRPAAGRGEQRGVAADHDRAAFDRARRGRPLRAHAGVGLCAGAQPLMPPDRGRAGCLCGALGSGRAGCA